MSVRNPFAHRVTELNDAPVRDRQYVLYWMQRSQRARANHALEYAVRAANERELPVLCCFGLTPDYPYASERHYRFLLEGLRESASTLRERGIGFALRLGDPPGVALDLGREAALIVCDRGYLAHLREWRYDVARTASCRVVEVESDLIVPVEEASTKREYAARTIRPRIHRRLGEFLVPLEETDPVLRGGDGLPRGENLEDTRDIDALLTRLRVAKIPGAVSSHFTGGASQAHDRLDRFVRERLPDYEEQRSEPSLDVSTGLSPYLHFGQISSLEIALAVGADGFVAGLESGEAAMKSQRGSVGMRTSRERTESSRDALLEELIVRRGLAYNYVWYTPACDRYDALPDWARTTLGEHESDERRCVYTDDELVSCATHDEFWNAAMREMLVTGSMHNYMRMYWGKKVLEWTPSPRDAYERLQRLNDAWFLDGRDPNSYANVGWVFGLHDRPWTEREVFGKVRYMNANGLKRKFHMDAYVAKVGRLASEAG